MSKVVGRIKAVLGLDKKGFDKGVKGVEKKTNALRGAFKKLGGAIAGAFAVKQIARMISKTITLSDELGKLSKQTGISTDSLQKYQYAGERAGISTERTSQSLQVFQKRLGELQTGSGMMYSQLNKMDAGFVKQLQSTKDVDEAFALYADRIKNARDETEQANLAQAGFSRSGLVMTRLLREGSEGLESYGNQLERTGGILSKDLIEAAEAYKDKQLDMNMAFRGLKGMLVTAIMPALSGLIEKLTAAGKWVKENSDKILKWAKGLGIAAAAIGVAKVAMIAFNAVMYANPIGLVITAVVALGAAVIAAWKKFDKFRAVVKFVAKSVAYFFKASVIEIKYSFKTLWEKIKAYFKAIGDSASVLWQTIKTAFTDGIQAAKKVFKDGFTEIVENIAEAGKDSREAMEKELNAIKPPSYEKILAKEQAVQAAKEAGRAAGKAFTEGFSEGRQRMSVPTSVQTRGTGGLGKAQIDALASSLDKAKQDIKKFQFEIVGLGNISNMVFTGMNNVISDALNSQEDTFKAFTQAFGNMIKGMIIKLMAATAAAFALAAALSIITGGTGAIGGTALGGAFKGAKSFGDFFGKGFMSMSGLGGMFKTVATPMASGGTVPPGYPSDTYPAMLSSGEKVLTPSQAKSGVGGRIAVDDVRIKNGDIWLSWKFAQDKRKNSY